MRVALTPLSLAIASAITFSHSNGFAATQNTSAMETMVVTATREAKDKSTLSESVSVLSEQDLELIAPSHPAEALNQIAGVHVNNLGGEGHMSAIRQPITTSGVYLFLEDGVPTRPTGYFNHNGLYEVNIPQSSRLEVTKGPASALYGSDAIGGVINSLTKPAPINQASETDINLEAGSHGWKRLLTSFATGINDHSGLRIDINATDSDGYRDNADYTRYSTTLRYDNQLTDKLKLKVLGSYSDIEQSGVSSLEYDDYKNDPKKNRYQGDIGYRDVKALRLSAEFNYQMTDDQLLTITPFYRDNSMEMMPSWMVTYDPNVRDYQFQSYGALLKFRQNLWQDRVQVITGLDIDYTPSTYEEEDITVTTQGDLFTDYQKTGNKHYDFESDQLSLAPYIHLEWQFAEKWRLNAGARYDYFEVDYSDKLAGQAVDSRHLRPESQTLRYDEVSPKLGLVYQYTSNHNAYLSYRQAFRAPTIGNLFRPGSSLESDQLEPVTSDSVELGLRGRFSPRLAYELAIYDMDIENDIVSFIDGSDRKSVNAGETSHKGIELSLQSQITDNFSVSLAANYTRQRYEDFSYVYLVWPSLQSINFAGFDVAKAPKKTANLNLTYKPPFLPKASASLEYEYLGEYYTDQTNTAKYDGHELVNLRLHYEVSPQLSTYLRVMNISDERYSTYTSNQVGDPDISYRPGLPRSVYAGVRLSF
ncbi:TonB-dependent receptor [Maricurvus nonylphenolicus]|uniref:TonB-dependent receptor n=1 Tax=Maricurvus nonylphenolicus TaxID=1008307 RepID=UPI0036F38333